MTSYTIEITPRAKADIRSVGEWFVSRRASDVALRWTAGLYAAISRLEVDPERMPFADEADMTGRPIRELLYGKRSGIYRVVFEVRETKVYVLRIRHSARDRLADDDL